MMAEILMCAVNIQQKHVMHMRVKRMEIAFQKKKGNIEDEMDGR
jgi:hypothetical protein